jgi:RNA polymerase sigma-70 factor (ECF subfamily)
MELLRPHYDAAARYCRLLCAPYAASTAEEVFQQAIVTAFEKIDTLGDRSRFRPWLFRIVQRTFLMERRRQTIRRRVPLPDPDTDPSVVYDPFERMAWKQALLGALAHLPAKSRATLLLHEVAGFTLQEIAALQGDRSLSATKMRLKRARAHMRALLADDTAPSDNTMTMDLNHETLRLIRELRSDN